MAQTNPIESVSIYSFPMRYIPLTDTKRGYVGTHWNKKYLRAIQVFSTPTQGKGVSSEAFFNASFGRDIQEFGMFLDMPEELIARRGKYIENKKHTLEEKLAKITKAEFNQSLVQEWYQLYEQMNKSGTWSDFAKQYVYSNSFPVDSFYQIKDPVWKEMFVYYMSIDLIAKKLPKMTAEEQEFIYKTFIQPKKKLHNLFYSI